MDSIERLKKKIKNNYLLADNLAISGYLEKVEGIQFIFSFTQYVARPPDKSNVKAVVKLFMGETI